MGVKLEVEHEPTEDELKGMKVGDQTWDRRLQLGIDRVHGGWLYYGWDHTDNRIHPSTFVPEVAK